MNEEKFAAGTVIYHQNDDSDAIFVISDGTVEVSLNSEDSSLHLGNLGRGDIFGETGVIQDKPRSTTMRALSDVSAVRFPKAAFLSTFNDKNPLGLPLLRMLCERLDKADNRLMEVAPPEGFEIATTAAVGDIRIMGASDTVQNQIGNEGHKVDSLPYCVGRSSSQGRQAGATERELLLHASDEELLSAKHFTIERKDGEIAVCDSESHLGTLVNGAYVSRFGCMASAALHFGANIVIAGGRASPYAFRILVERK